MKKSRKNRSPEIIVPAGDISNVVPFSEGVTPVAAPEPVTTVATTGLPVEVPAVPVPVDVVVPDKPTPIAGTFVPLPDITAYELATVLPFFLGRPMYEADWASLGGMTRHIKRG